MRLLLSEQYGGLFISLHAVSLLQIQSDIGKTNIMKIAIAQLYTPNYNSWAPIVINNTKSYCDTHSYQFFHKIIEYPKDRHPAWYRIPFILDLFEKEDVDWVFWSDIDSLIMNHSIRIEDFLKDDKDLIIASQGYGWYCGIGCEQCLNTGQFFIKNWCQFFRTCYCTKSNLSSK